MKKVCSLFVLSLFIIVCCFGCTDGLVWKKYEYSTKAPEDKGEVTLSGKLICLNCTFDQSPSAINFCKENGHQHALMTVEGEVYSLVADYNSNELIKSEKYHNKAVTITGRILERTKAIKIRSFEVF